ncbi:hypothetical protein BJ912DRAFT_1081687, partial [Pholiota molesta]
LFFAFLSWPRLQRGFSIGRERQQLPALRRLPGLQETRRPPLQGHPLVGRLGGNLRGALRRCPRPSPRRPPPVLRLANRPRLSQPLPRRQSLVLRLRLPQASRPVLPSRREGLTLLSLRTSRMHGRTIYGGAVSRSSIPSLSSVSARDLSSPSRASSEPRALRTAYRRLSSSLTLTVLLPPKFKKVVTSAPSLAPNSSHSLVPSKHLPSPSFRKLESLVAFALYKTSPSHSLHPLHGPAALLTPSFAPLIFPAHGGLLPLFQSSLHISHLAHRLPYATSPRLIAQCLYILLSGRQRWCAPGTMPSTSTRTPPLGQVLRGVAMATSLMVGRISTDPRVLALWQASSTTISFSASFACGLRISTRFAGSGRLLSLVGLSTSLAAAFGMVATLFRMVKSSNWMRTVPFPSAISPLPRLAPTRMPPSRTASMTSTVFPRTWGFPGSTPRTDRLPLPPFTSGLCGTSPRGPWRSVPRRRKSTWPPSTHGLRRRCTPSRRSRNCMASSCMPAWCAQQAVLASPTWRPLWASTVIVLSSRGTLRRESQMISSGGVDDSQPLSIAASPQPLQSSTVARTLMPALALVSRSSSLIAGVPGAWSPAGKPSMEAVTLPGPRPLASSSSSPPSSFSTQVRSALSKSTATTKVSSKVGGTTAVATPLSMMSSSASTASWNQQIAWTVSALPMSPVPKIPPTNLLVASTPLVRNSSLPFPFSAMLAGSSST